MKSRNLLLASLAIAAALGCTRDATAQAYPSRPITIIVPNPAGGPMDTVARIIAERVRGALGQAIIIENVPGASGSIGTGRVARAAGDGYTLSLGGWSQYVANGAVYVLNYDLVKDFEPIMLVATQPLLLVANKSVPAKNLTELIAWLKANPDKAWQGTGGHLDHVAGVLFQKETGTRFGFVPYRGINQAMQDLVGRQIDLMIATAPTSLPAMQAGSIKAYAVTAKSRLATAPNIPTVDEAGVPGLHFSSWQALWAPKGTPKDLIAKLNAIVVDALADPAVRHRLADLGQEIFPREQQTPEALGTFQKAEIGKWWPIIKEAGIRPE
jgi:tripartite-type tricarboxylate transporter receptor subunit TctC